MLAGKADLREGIDGAKEQRLALERRKLYGKRTILFVKQIVEILNQAFI